MWHKDWLDDKRVRVRQLGAKLPRGARAGLRLGKQRERLSGILDVLNLATCSLSNVYDL